MSEYASTPAPRNRLARETSPYLLQHAHNPVDWYPWGEEALARARAEDRPILLSIGYSACHWCHVMERESFEDPATAELMNRWFVNVKVDREERPDLDQVYMQAVQAMTGRGGWPMTMFLTPDGKPFWGGTYFPPDDRGGMPGFKRVLRSIAEAWETRRDEVLQSGAEIGSYLEQAMQPAAGDADLLGPDLIQSAAEGMCQLYDARHGGFGSAPKFPQPMAVELLLRAWRRTGTERFREVALGTLHAMTRGGIHDHLGGGFARYSVDEMWLTPHFEKMLYDNAQLARAYVLGYQASGDAALQLVAERTLDYLLRDLSDPGGGFYSSEDADSEGEEGRFYVWTPDEIRGVLGEEDGRIVAAYYGVTEQGNFEHGRSVLHETWTPSQVATTLGTSEEAVLAALERGRVALFQARQHRVRPHRDEKVLTAWNGLALRAFAEASRVLRRPSYAAAAERCGTFLLETMVSADGRVLRTWRRGHAAHINGYLEDYANLADGLLALYEATFQARWLEAARATCDQLLERFSDPSGDGFFDTSADHERLVARPRELADNPTPSGNAVTADVLLRLALLTGDERYREAARPVLAHAPELARRYPLGFARLLSAVDLWLSEPREVALVGGPHVDGWDDLVDAAFEPFLPNKVVVGGVAEDAERLPLLRDRPMIDGRATAYVCVGTVCQAPVTEPGALREQLEAA